MSVDSAAGCPPFSFAVEVPMKVFAGMCERVKMLVNWRWVTSALGSSEDVSTNSRWSREKGGRGSAANEREMCEISVGEGDG